MDLVTIKDYAIEDDIFRIRYVNEKSYAEMKKTHFHNHYEIYYLLRGEKLFFVNDRLLKAGKGDMVIIRPYDVHKTSSVESVEAERTLIYFKDNFLEPLLNMESFSLEPCVQESCKISFNVKEQMHIEKILSDMLRECELKEDSYISYVRSLLFMLLIKVHRHNINESALDENTNSPMEKKVLEIASYICSNYSNNITLNSIAQKFYISDSYLSRTFKKVTGSHMSEYIQLVRVREAQKLIKETSYKIIEVAEMVGFNQIAHFNKTFKKITGTSPLKYRNSDR